MSRSLYGAEPVPGSEPRDRRLTSPTLPSPPRSVFVFFIHRLEVVLLAPMGDVFANVRASGIGETEMDTLPHARVDDLLDRIGEAREAPRRARDRAERAERDLVRSEE